MKRLLLLYLLLFSSTAHAGIWWESGGSIQGPVDRPPVQNGIWWQAGGDRQTSADSQRAVDPESSLLGSLLRLILPE